MPANLTDNYVANTYKGVLHVNGEELPDDARVQVYDGAGNKTAIKLGINSVDCLSLSAQGLTANDFKYPEEPGAVFNVLCQTSENVAGEVNTLELRNIKDILCGTPDAGLASYSRESNSVVPIFNIECGMVEGVEDVEITNITSAAGGINRQSTGNFNVSFISLTGGIVKGLTLTPVSLAPQPNLLLNAQGIVNQRQFTPGSDIVKVWNPRRYFLDRWRSNNGTSISWRYDTPNVVTIGASGGVSQTIEKINIIPGIHTLSWRGNAVATILRHGTAQAIATGSGGTGEIKTITANLDANYDIEIRFTGGDFSLPKFERGSTRTEFDYRNFGSELSLCQRYFSKTYPYATPPHTIQRSGAIHHHGTEPINPTSHNLQWRFPAEQRQGNIVWSFSPFSIGELNRFAISGQLDNDPTADLNEHTCAVSYSTNSVLSVNRKSGKEDRYPPGEMRLASAHFVADGEF